MSYESLEQMVAAAASAVRPPERLTVAEAAEKYRFINNPGSYVGYWDNTFAPYLVEPMEVLTSTEHTGMVFAGPARTGKALPLYTPIPTPTGWTTMGDLQEGDLVLGRNGKPCRVTAATDVMYGHKVYRLCFDDGSSIEADAGHKWLVETLYGSRWVRTTEELVVDYLKPTHGGARVRSRYAIPVPEPLDLPEAELPIPPYTLGVWLGDGAVQSAALDLFSDDADEIVAGIAAEGGIVTERNSGKANARDFTVKYATTHRDTLVGRLRKLGFIGTGKAQCRHIPAVYQRASIEQRRQLLRGLMDTDGTVANGGRSCEFSTSVELLACDIRELLSGLGIKSTVRSKIPTFRHKGELREGRRTYTVSFTPEFGADVFSLRRYIEAIDGDESRARPGHTRRRWIREIVEVPTTPVRCIQVDSEDHLFLAGEQMIPTHNSDMFFNWLTYTAVCDPADMMMVHMTMSVARDWSQKDLRRAWRHSKELGKTVAPGRHNQSTHDIRFLSGMHLLVKWPTITELSGKTVGRNWIADYDRISPSIDDEGSAFSLTAKRAETFRRHGMTVAESSPGFDIMDAKWQPSRERPHEAPPVAGGVLALYNQGDRRRWLWRCPHCAEPFEPDFKLFVIPDSHDLVEAAEATTMACPHCGGMIWHDGRNGDPGKHELNQTELGNARWVKEGQLWTPRARGEAGVAGHLEGRGLRSDLASFWLKGPAANFADWRGIVLKYLQALEVFERTGAQEALKTTINTDQGLPFLPKGMESGRLAEDVKAMAEDLGEGVVPPGVRFLVATVDVQKGRFEVQVHGFGYGGDITVIDRFAIKKSRRLDEDGEREPLRPASYLEDWDLLIDEVMLKTYPLADGSGRRMKMRMIGCDSGGAASKKNDSSTTKNAYAFYRRLKQSDGEAFPAGLHRRFLLLKGGSTPTAPRVKISYPDSERRDRHAGARGDVPILMLNTTALKDQLDAMLDRESGGGGKIRFVDWLPEEFWEEMVAEARGVKGWEKLSARNEAWDLLVYAIAIALYRPIKIETLNWDQPPGWAEEWDVNDLVFDPAKGDKSGDKAPQRTSLRDLAAALA